ncbi:MAG: hypothetical protein NXY57DRAFT_1014485 [Lentinula lateritia]|nr:MAG: hypothetical protein NXY57DRAFT_1014485 [Lentinula lateritia]
MVHLFLPSLFIHNIEFLLAEKHWDRWFQIFSTAIEQIEYHCRIDQPRLLSNFHPQERLSKGKFTKIRSYI